MGTGTSGRALFLDRDGVLNDLVADGTASGRSPRSTSELRFVPGARTAVHQAAHANLVPIIVTNQPDVARGVLESSVLADIHSVFRRVIPDLAGIYVCEHSGNVCSCRKPRTGMLLQAARDLGLALADSWMVGDRWVDIAAAQGAGCRSVLISRPYSWVPNSSGAPEKGLRPTMVATDVLDAVHLIRNYEDSLGL